MVALRWNLPTLLRRTYCGQEEKEGSEEESRKEKEGRQESYQKEGSEEKEGGKEEEEKVSVRTSKFLPTQSSDSTDRNETGLQLQPYFFVPIATPSACYSTFRLGNGGCCLLDETRFRTN